MMGDFVRFLVGTVLLSTFVAAMPGIKDNGAGVSLDKGEQPAQELKPALPDGDSTTKGPDAALPDVGSPPVIGAATKGLKPTLTDVRSPAQGQPGSPQIQRRDSVLHSTVSDADKETIVSMHNQYRRDVMPTAAIMLKLQWSEKLENSAQQVANECREGGKHDDAGERRTKSRLGIPVGQNYALGPNNTNWSNAVNAWHAEIKDFTFGVDVSEPVGHYTQMVLGKSSHVGCGSKECPALAKDGQPRRSFYCNYAYMNMDYTNPYVLGDSCEQCPNHCENGLCNCGDVICEFGGTLDLNTCRCTCSNGFSGDSCTTCPLVDESFNCGTAWNTDYCGQYTNVRDECPCMCGDCVRRCSNDINCSNGGKRTEVGDGTCMCTCPAGFTGSSCGCQVAWDVNDDDPGCAGVGMDYCSYSNIRDDLCKFKCNC